MIMKTCTAYDMFVAASLELDAAAFSGEFIRDLGPRRKGNLTA